MGIVDKIIKITDKRMEDLQNQTNKMIKELIELNDGLISIWDKLTDSERKEFIDKLNQMKIKYK